MREPFTIFLLSTISIGRLLEQLHFIKKRVTNEAENFSAGAIFSGDGAQASNSLNATAPKKSISFKNYGLYYMYALKAV
jgi:hypothetical protein